MRRRLGRIVGALALALGPTLALVSMSTTPSAVAQGQQLSLGRDLYVQSCASCHGADASGTGQGPPLLGVGAASLDFMLSTGRMPLADPAEQPMRTEPAFSAEEIAAIDALDTGVRGGPDPDSITLETYGIAAIPEA